MIRTFGIGPRAKKVLFGAFGIGHSAENVDKSPVKFKKTIRRENDRFRTVLESVDVWIRQRVVLDLFSNFRRARSSGYFFRTSRASDNSTWAIHGKQRNGDEE